MKKTHRRVLLLVKFQVLACNFTKSNTPPWVFFTFFLKKRTKSRKTSHINKILFTDPNTTTNFEIKKAVSIM